MLLEAIYATQFRANDRYATFEEDEWPHNFENVTPRLLADNGFVYCGIDDHVKCFACGKELQNWEESDNIDEEHERRNECLYLSYLKGGGSPNDLDLGTSITILKEIYRRTMLAIEGAVFDDADVKKAFTESKAKRKPKKK